MVMRALSLSLAQLGDRRIIGIFAKSMLITLLLFVLLFGSVITGAQMAAARFGLVTQSDSWILGLGLLLAGLLVAGALFRGLAVPVLGFFGDDVVAAIEAKHYPDAAQSARKAGVGLSARLALMSLARFALFNLLALPVYIFLLVTGIGPIIAFIAVNAILLGRDMGEMVAVRHLEGEALAQWLANSRVERGVLGLIVSGLFMIPFANLIAPVLGAAAATHLFHGRQT
jgi:CysZ protein